MTETVHGVPLPPEDLVFMDQDADRGYRHGMRLAKRLGEVGANVEDGLLLDVGCGYGRLAYGLLGNGFRGNYVGLDILPDRIEFLQSYFTPVNPRYRFHLLDVSNDLYVRNHPKLSKSNSLRNVTGRKSTVVDGGIDFSAYVNSEPSSIVLLSVFTHMYDVDIIEYLRALKRVMGQHSKLVFTAFAYNDEILSRISRGESKVQLPEVLSRHCRTASIKTPLEAIAYVEGWIYSVLRAEGFACEPVLRGNWSGQQGGEYQDWFVAELA